MMNTIVKENLISFKELEQKVFMAKLIVNKGLPSSQRLGTI